MAHQDAVPSPHADRAGLVGFFRSRWRGETPLGTLFWRDMVLVATLISIFTTLAAVVLLGFEMPMPIVLATHFAPLPYNIFLFLAVWRTSGRISGWTAQAAPLGAAVWLAFATVI